GGFFEAPFKSSISKIGQRTPVEDIQRKAIVELARNILGYAKTTIYKVYNACNDSGKDSRKAPAPRSSHMTPTLTLLAGLKKSIMNNLRTPISLKSQWSKVLAKNRAVASMTISNVGLKSYAMRVRQLLI
ncbi:hypothetical protein TCAL_15353, partial [Tigriopus californicus]